MKQVKLVKIASTKTMVQLLEDGKIYWANASAEAYKNAQAIKVGEVLVDIKKEEGKLPLVDKLYSIDSPDVKNPVKTTTEPKKIEEIEKELVEHPKLTKEPKILGSSVPYLSPANLEEELNKTLTAKTIQALIGSITVDNVSDVIKNIYNTYKNL